MHPELSTVQSMTFFPLRPKGLALVFRQKTAAG